MKIIETVSAFREWRNSLGANTDVNTTVGFVPTMGALHEGHASLLARARAENDIVVLSIFVNPTQFNNPEDLAKYPKTWETDIQTASRHGVDVIFAPKDMKEMYPDGYRYQLSEKEFSNELCGAHRPGHFDGVLTVVMKLFQLIKPKRAYFGEKDYQQLSLIREMINAFFLDVDLVSCPTIREASGLAMSSRNMRLTAEELSIAPKLHSVMNTIEDLQMASAALTEAGFKVEYLVDRENRRYAAAWLGNVRLIDNIELKAKAFRS
jgi:pantoate--beta-alanine ligase